MPKLTPFLQKVFGGSLAAYGNIEAFGSTAGGTPNFTLDPNVIQTAQWLQGWAAAQVGVGSPVKQDRNALDYLFSLQMATFQQNGIPIWIATKDYYQKSSWVQGSDGMLYQSLSDDNVGHDPTTDTNNWISLPDLIRELVVPAATIAKFWVRFDGANGNILAAYNVDHVTRISAGVYDIVFEIPMSSPDYAWSGSCSSQNGGSPVGGNNNIIIGGGAQVVGSLRVINWESTGGPIGPEDGQRICVSGFGN